MRAPSEVLYTVRIGDPGAHLAEVELTVRDAASLGPRVRVTMAAWSPGSYLVRDYARMVRELSATADGEPAPARKVDKQTWEIETGGADEVQVRYRVYGHELTVRTNHIDHSHAFLHGPATYLYLESLRELPHRVTLVPPAQRDWHVALALPVEEGAYVAADLDELLDSPVHMGEATVRVVDAEVPVELVVWGPIDGTGVADLDRLARDLAIIVRAHGDRFDGAPFHRYTFMLMLAPGSYGGLEHRASSANLHNPQAFATEKSYADLLELLSHELFHAWNGKRMHPAGLADPAYGAEQYTRCLWVIEGLTSYYDRITLRRSGQMSTARYLEKLCDEWARLMWTPGRAAHSLEEASFDAWIKLYQAHESNVNTSVSYYLKGGLVAMALDLVVRAETAGARSLDHVLAAMWRDYVATGAPYPEDVQAIFEAATGVELGALFDDLVRGTGDPDLARLLDHAGLVLRATHDTEKDENVVGAPPWLGIACRSGCRVSRVLDGSPAADAGLSPGDEIAALDRLRVRNDADLRQRLRARSDGDRIDLTVFRGGHQRQVEVVLAPCPPNRYEITALAEPTAEQRAFHHGWLGEDHPAHGQVIAGATVGPYL